MLLNGSVFNYNEIYESLKLYKQNLGNKNNYELYFAKVDIKCCFESINQNTLMEIIYKNIFTEVCI